METFPLNIKLIIVLCVAAVLVMVGLLILFRYRVSTLKVKLAEALQGAVLLDAVVESVQEDKSPVLLFRNAEDNATIIHKYKGTGLRRYKSNEQLQIYYNDRTDYFCVADDNPIFKEMFDTAKWCIIGTLTVPIILLVIVIIMIVRSGTIENFTQ
jgi:hypothetical protein